MIFAVAVLLALTGCKKGGDDEIYVRELIPVEAIKFPVESMTMMVGEVEQLACDITPSNASTINFGWYSSKPEIAKVSETGVLTAVSSGETLITVSYIKEGAKPLLSTLKVEVKSDGDEPIIDPYKQKPILKTVTIPATGDEGFMMGTKAPLGFVWTYETQHKVILTKPFKMAECETTIEDFAKFLNATEVPPAEEGEVVRVDGEIYFGVNPKFTPVYDKELKRWKAATTADEKKPVTNVGFWGAKRCAEWLGGDLPTEAQWEYAARGGSKTDIYFFGELSDKLSEYAWFNDNSNGETHPVRGLKPNGFGLYDICGNAAEWCLDYYKQDLGTATVTDPYTAKDEQEETFYGEMLINSHIIRGGSFTTDTNNEMENDCRIGYRNIWGEDKIAEAELFDYTLTDHGFRIVFPAD